jgi:hypothetical protein
MPSSLPAASDGVASGVTIFNKVAAFVARRRRLGLIASDVASAAREAELSSMQ